MAKTSNQEDLTVLDFDILRMIYAKDSSGKNMISINRKNYYDNLEKNVTNKGIYGRINTLANYGYIKEKNVEGKLRYSITKKGIAKLGTEMPLTTVSGTMIFYKASQATDDKPVKLVFVGNGEFTSNRAPIRHVGEKVEIILEKGNDSVSVKALERNKDNNTIAKVAHGRRGERHNPDILVKTDAHVNVEARTQAVEAELGNQPSSSFWHLINKISKKT